MVWEAFRPRPFNGRSMSRSVSSFQLDLAWRKRYKVFIPWVVGSVPVYSAVTQLTCIGEMILYGNHRFPGKLFVVEGTDGSGKSTQLALLYQWLKAEGYPVFFSEWNSSPLVKDTTKRAKKRHLFTPATFSLLHATDFLHLGDDFYDSFIAYQTRMLGVFDRMSTEYGFHVLNSSRSVRSVAADLRRAVAKLLDESAAVGLESASPQQTKSPALREVRAASNESKLKKIVAH